MSKISITNEGICMHMSTVGAKGVHMRHWWEGENI